ncbi:RNA polymerase sigma factor [Microbacterium sp.]|uniref:RNA polymerase sigma factor n=1 Tax=Microbacterium sp. TaxID=51671 RepID=UPI003F9D8DE0
MSAIDEDVWAAALSGDGDAFGVLFDRHRARVYRHSRGLAPSWSDADDVVAVTFLEAWRKRDHITFVDGSMLPWLLRTATFTANNLRRSSRRHNAALRRLPAGPVQSDHADLFDDGEAMTAMKELSPLDQEVLTLCVIEDVSTEDAARLMRVRVGTIKSRLSRAKERLRAAIDESASALRPEGVNNVL